MTSTTSSSTRSRLETCRPREVSVLVAELLRGGADERALAQRIENLGLGDWEVWAGEQRSAAEVVAEGGRVTVLDLAGFHDPRESAAVTLDLVENLWAQRKSRTPTLIVIDEAHNVCPAAPVGSIQTLLVERLIQIAAEGRKYGSVAVALDPTPLEGARSRCCPSATTWC